MSAAATWTLISAIGVLVAVWGTLDSWGDLRALRHNTNGRRIIAIGYLRGELIHLVILSAWTVLGYLALERASTWNPGTVVLIVGNGLLVLRSVLDARDRLRVRKALHPPLP